MLHHQVVITLVCTQSPQAGPSIILAADPKKDWADVCLLSVPKELSQVFVFLQKYFSEYQLNACCHRNDPAGSIITAFPVLTVVLSWTVSAYPICPFAQLLTHHAKLSLGACTGHWMGMALSSQHNSPIPLWVGVTPGNVPYSPSSLRGKLWGPVLEGSMEIK